MYESEHFKIYVFDAYGTLFDVHSAVRENLEQVGEGATRLSEIWRNKQLEYSWVSSLMGEYRDFWLLTEEALDFAFASVPTANTASRASLLAAYQTLSAYDEVADVLANLKEAGAKTAILSNGSPDMLSSAVSSAGLEPFLDAAISVDAVRKFKTSPQVYQLVCDRFDVRADEVAFQSSNRWDIAGAKKFGFTCHWINRTGQPEEYAKFAPDRTLKDLRELL